MVRSHIPAYDTSVQAADENQKAISVLTLAGAASCLGYFALFFLLQSRSLWASPTLVADRWPALFYPIKGLFPAEWLTASSTSQAGLLNAMLYLSLLAFLFAVYWYMLKRFFAPLGLSEIGARKGLRRLTFFTAAALAILFVVPGMFSTDLFSYIWYGRIFALYGDNPFFSVPGDYAWIDRSGWIQWVYWTDTPSVYGPIWVWLSAAIAYAAQAVGGDIVDHLLGHKLVASGAHLLNVFLLWRVAGTVVTRYWTPAALSAQDEPEDRHRRMRLAITCAYALNPLLLIEFGASGHSDVLLITGLLMALWLHLRGLWRWAVFVLAVTTLVKLAAVLFLPGYIWLLMWDRRSSEERPRMLRAFGVIVQAAAIVVITWVLTYWPFWRGPSTLQALAGGPPAEFFIHSLGTVIRFRLAELIAWLADLWGLSPARFWSVEAVGARLDWPARWGLLIIAAAVGLLQTWGARTFPKMVIAWGWVLLAYLTVASVWFWPWYVSWLVVPVALVGPSRIFTATQILCASSLSVYALSPEVAAPLDWIPGWTGLVVAGPPLAYVLGSYLAPRLRHRMPIAERAADTGRSGSGEGLALPVQFNPSTAPSNAMDQEVRTEIKNRAELGYRDSAETSDAAR